MSFKDKVVIVTGGSSGIGAATAILFAKEGADVAIVGRNEAKLKNVAEKCAKIGERPLIIKIDIGKNDPREIVKKTIEKFGKLDILVNNAGIIGKDSIDEDMTQIFDEVMNVNLRSAVLLTNAAMHNLKVTKGNVVNVSSTVGNSPCPMISYAVSKAGLQHFTRCVAVLVGKSGVRVNTVSPGPVVTDIIENSKIPNIGTYEDWGANTPLERVSQPEEIAEMIAYVSSDKAKGITGAKFAVDNGANLKI